MQGQKRSKACRVYLTLRNRLGPRAINPFPGKPKRIGKRVLFDIKALDSSDESLPTT
ncbi:MAG TPA: hypothetical protein PK575_13920 [Syntrophorhabdus sp.]|nr:hypothetical protein [Syntrophorhabdus sp.]